MGLAKTTELRVGGSALVLFFRSNELHRAGQIRSIITGTVAFSVWVQYLVSLQTFSLWIELILQPLLILTVLVVAVSGSREDIQSAKRHAEVMLSLIGIGLIAASVHRLFEYRTELDWIQESLEFALPVWLTVAVLPYLMGWNLLVSYESAFVRLERFAPGDRISLKMKTALLVGLGIRVKAAAEFASPWLQDLAQTRTFREGLASVRHYRASRAV